MESQAKNALGVTIFVVIMTLLALAQVAHPQTKPATKSSASVEDPQLYRNPTFGFSYPIPYSWVTRTKEMQKGNEASKSQVLLAVFERPPEATGNSVNSAVVIASESAASYPGLKRVEDYLGPLTELATSNGLKADGEPDSIEIDARQLLRANFTKSLGDKLTMYQSTFVLLAKGQIVSFTFIGGSEDDLDNLVEGLHFGPAKPASPQKTH